MAPGGQPRVRGGLLERRGPGGVVVLDPATDTEPVRLLGTAADIWSLLRAGASVEQVVAAMSLRYGTPAVSVEQDIRSFVDDLAARGLLA